MKPAIVSIFVLLVGCSEAPSFSEADQRRVAGEVDSMLHAYHDAMREGGLLTEFDFLDSTDAFFWVPPGYDSWLSYDSVESAIQTNARGLQSTDFRWEELRIDPISNDYATFTGVVHGVTVDTAGQVTEMDLVETGTVVRREGGWMLLNGQSAVLDGEE